jgi:signal peptidase II
MARFGKLVWFVLLLPTLVGFDWGTKELTRAMPLGAEIQLVPGWVSWVHAENPDIAFSIPAPMTLVLVFGFVALGLLGVTLWRLPADARAQGAALAVMAAGAIGNLVDRLGDGSVTDFLRVYTVHPSIAPWLVSTFGTSSWPVFNVADVCLLLGVGMWTLHAAFEREQPPLAA